LLSKESRKLGAILFVNFILFLYEDGGSSSCPIPSLVCGSLLFGLGFFQLHSGWESDIVTCESTWHHVGVDGMRMKNVAI
jgi:hypothetical protein